MLFRSVSQGGQVIMPPVFPSLGSKRILPNATATLVLGILSVLFSFTFIAGLLGAVLGIIGLSLSSDGVKMYRENPDYYEGYASLNAGRIMCIVGVVIGSLIVFIYLSMLLLYGSYMSRFF